ncbi:MAG: hypothetical protein EOP06_11870 [Proteobacteria bacterium]|nr:MAG: hypothetical protein EOP06_11870 [Pseudomonadota bacterium]
MKYLPKIQQETEWSCALACIESILLAAEVDYPQRDMLAAMADDFPEWIEHPGLISPANFPKVFEAAGMTVDMLQPKDIPETRELLSGSIGAIISRGKYWKDETKSELVGNWHALQLLEVEDARVIVMNPGFSPRASTLESIPVGALKLFESCVYVFRRQENPA